MDEYWNEVPGEGNSSLERRKSSPEAYCQSIIRSRWQFVDRLMPPDFGCLTIQATGLISKNQCRKFKLIIAQERIKAVKENHVFFSCLKRTGREHRSATCSKRKWCPETSVRTQCKYCHHPFYVRHCKPPLQLLPPLWIELKRKGKRIPVTITKMGGQDEELNTKMYQIRLRSVEDYRALTMQAIEIPSLSEDIWKERMDEIARQFGFGKGQPCREFGTADLPIWINQAKFHTGQTEEARDMVARHSPLGWVVFGSTPRPDLTHAKCIRSRWKHR